ncbi:5174_t:CDS:2, partial [Paraglomus occultum]
MASEQSELDRTSSLIGRYLLTGWILSDEVCPNKGCNVPLLRSKDNSTWLCARCDNNDSKPRSTTELPYQAYESFAPPVESIGMEQETSEEVEERQLRRKQSQLAAQLIGERMLQGWTLLDEICPNETCYGASVDDRLG